MAPLARWVRRTPKDWATLVLRQKDCGLSQASYCRREGVSLTSFEKWKQRLLSEPRFVDVTPSADRPNGWELEVSLPSRSSFGSERSRVPAERGVADPGLQ
jgi:hypothetical protein